MESSKKLYLAFSTILISLIFSACNVSNTKTANKSPVTVKMNVQSSSPAKQIASSPTTQAVDSLTEVKFLVKKLELKSHSTEFDGNENDHEDGEAEDSLDFELRNFVANLPLDGSDLKITSKDVPVGLYNKFEVKIAPPEDPSSIQDTDFYNSSSSDTTGYSIVVKGIYNGEQFVYNTSEDFHLELELNPPLEVTDTTAASVSVNIDPSSWFTDSSGNTLDPTNPDNQEQIDANIKKSFHAEHETEHEDEHGDTGDENGDS